MGKKHFRMIGDSSHGGFVELADFCHPTITGSIRCRDVERQVKEYFNYLEVQEIYTDDGDYDVVDSWSK